MRPLEFNAGWRQAQRFVDDQIGHHSHHPGNGHVGVQAQDVTERLKHVHLHQHEGDQCVEHHPHHPPRMAVREPREKVGPGQRPRIRIGDIDLELRDHHKQGCRGYGPTVIRKDIFVGCQVHLVGIYCTLHGHRVGNGQPRQQCTAQHLEHAQHHPARTAHQHPHPPAALIGCSFDGHKAKVVGLFAHLGHQGNAHRKRRTKQGQTESCCRSFIPFVMHNTRKRTRIKHKHINKRNDQHHQPQWLGPDLQATDGRDPVGHQRNHHQRADQIAPTRRNAQRQFQRVGHDGRLQRKENEGE